MKFLHGLLIVSLLIVATLSWQDWFTPQRPVEQVIEMLERKSDYYLEAFTIDTLTAAGALKHRLSGKTLTHFPHDDSAEIEDLRLLLVQPGKPSWTITSQYGWITSGAVRAELRGEVVMIRADAPGAPGIRIDSRDMRLDTQSHQFDTDAPVLIVSDLWQARGTGMRSNTDTGDFTLLANVKYTYEPAL